MDDWGLGMADQPECKFTYSDIKFADSEGMFQRALDLFCAAKVTKFASHPRGFNAVVKGGSNYHVSISSKKIDDGACDCYMGQDGQLCKHLLALGLFVLQQNGMIDERGQPTGNAKLAPADARLHIAAGVRKIRPYDGPSRIWFGYQRDLDIGVGMIAEGVNLLEPSLDNAKYLWKLVIRLSRKLSHGGVDDSNGTVGGGIDDILSTIVDMTMSDKKIRQYVIKNCTEETGFGFEENLANLMQKTSGSKEGIIE
ncbi:hypothetical protein BH23PAT2_BH23PAT2_00820 [soil metagenome]